MSPAAVLRQASTTWKPLSASSLAVSLHTLLLRVTLAPLLQPPSEGGMRCVPMPPACRQSILHSLRHKCNHDLTVATCTQKDESRACSPANASIATSDNSNLACRCACLVHESPSFSSTALPVRCRLTSSSQSLRPSSYHDHCVSGAAAVCGCSAEAPSIAFLSNGHVQVKAVRPSHSLYEQYVRLLCH